MLEQLNIYGRDKVEQAIKRLQDYEPEDGYYLAFSGGKDSVTIKALADMAGVKYVAHYQVTSIDPPELVQFVKTFDDVSMDIPRDKDGKAYTMWRLIVEKRIPPTRVARYCCLYLKEHGGTGRFKVTGVRHAESTKRKNRGGVESSTSLRGRYVVYDPDTDPVSVKQAIEGKKVRILNPIIDWSTEDVWQFIREHGVRYCSLYDEGFTRLGCVGCPMATKPIRLHEFERWPKMRAAYIRAFDKMIADRIADNFPTDWKDGEDVMAWWVHYNDWDGQAQEKKKPEE